MTDETLDERTPAAEAEQAAPTPAEKPAEAVDDPFADTRAALQSLTDDEGDKGEAQPAGEAQPERARGPDGKFIKAEEGAEKPTTPPADKAAAPADKVSDQDDKPKAEAATSSPPSGPPAGWSADAKAAWNQLPPAIQAAVSRREQEVSDGFRQKSEELKMWQGIEQQLAPRRQTFAQMGYRNDAQVVDHLLTFADAYTRNPAGLIQHLAETAGIDLRQLAQQPAGQQQRPTASAQPPATRQDPQIASLTNELTTLKQQMSQREVAEAAATLKAFAADPKHPHFEEVRADMARLLQAGEPDIEAAYQKAVWANPATREKLLAEQAAAGQRQKADKSASAARAAVSPRGGGPNGAVPANRIAEANDPFEAARAAFDSLSEA